ncbi:uncharacterized protein LOC105208736 [Zeugodacus cucurbitae]|uniref:Uncharacterized protein n=1 Tax=Zeugodacus cucurbitae TaxID=28588 RepID=A0A0A1WXH4_ZEUCU|nr:uncharacterized protein LOC105208736 [Zeugodacus cucurbitae]
MEDAVKPAEQHKSDVETSNVTKKWNTAIGQTQTTPTAKLQGNKTTNKPNQGWKSTKRKNVRQNESRRKELPHFVRTEMEILKHLRRVNRDLRILLQPKNNSDQTSRCCNQRGGNQSPPTRHRREQKPIGKAAQSKASAVCKKSQNALAQVNNMKSKRQKTQQVNAATNANGVVAPQTNKSSTGKTQGGNTALTPMSSTATRRNTLKRLMLYFRSKKKLDASLSVQKSLGKDNNKKSDANEAMQSKTQNTLYCKIKRSLQATRARNEKQKAHSIKPTDTPVKEDVGSTQKCKEEKVLKQKVKGRERILKPKVRPEKSLKQQHADEEPTNQKPKAQDAQKLQEKEAESTHPSVVKVERTVREKMEKMLALRMKCFRAESMSLHDEDDNKNALMANQKRYFLSTINATAPNAECAQPEQQTLKQIESTISNGRFGNCLPFFKALRKAQVPIKPTKEKTPCETELKKVYKKRKLRQDPTNIEYLPSSSQINMKYVEAIKAIRRHNRDIYKDPHETPSTSSLEEYFLVLSERMAREQKEADERKPRHGGRRGMSNYNLQRRRARPPIK